MGNGHKVNKMLGLSLMESKNVTLRMITKKASALRLERFLTFNLLHPELTDEHLHPTKRVLSFLCYFGLFFLVASATDFLFFRKFGPDGHDSAQC
jgi:hypothetical protein